ncbi:MAG TPA: HIT family protein [Candidatus Paceibacterota bacterium]
MQENEEEKNCIFCKIVAGEIVDYKVWEDEQFVAFLDVRPIADGHVLIVPKIHVDVIYDLSDDIYTSLFSRAKKLAPVIKEVTNCKRVGMAVEGFGVAHCHLHLVPLFGTHELDPDRAHNVAREELIRMKSKLCAVLDGKK